ncbi:MAG: ATP-binding protein [Rhodoferax sp.]|nr:ATP-binding protein [Rhodoferax sp.]
MRRRLLLLLSGAVLVAWAATALFTYFDARQQIGQMLDAHLVQSADLIAAQTEHGLAGDADLTVPRQYTQKSQIAFQVWDRSAALRWRSANAPQAHLGEQGEGFSDATIDGERWRIFSRRDESGRYVVQVGERFELRDELAQSVASHLLHPLAVALPVLAILIWLSVNAGLLPLGAVARQVQRRTPDNLAPLGEQAVPREVSPLVQALNALFGRLRATFEQERRFTADAAHELRTPLAGVKTQAQVALAATSGEERRRALSNVVLGVDRATHLVEQLLVLARLDPQAALPGAMPVALPDLAAACIAEQAQAAADKGVDLALESAGEAVVLGDQTLLSLLLRNLIDNAICYSPVASEVEVRIARTHGVITLCVTDSGPGIPEGERDRVFDRFYRITGSAGDGSGLGLSIVKRIADLHHATIRLSHGSAGRGLTVEVTFPATGH